MPYVRQAVQSVLDQTLRDWRCVIVNDGSTDGTRDFLNSIGDDRFVILHQENGGIAAAVNHGLEHCHTPYVARMDADDVALPTRLAEQVVFLDAHLECGLVGTQTAPFGERGAGASLKLPLEHDAIMRALITGRHAMAHSSIMVRTDVLRQVGGYWSLPMGEEYDIMLRIGEVARLANLDRVLLLYRVHQASMNGSRMRQMRISVAYAGELARRRQRGLPTISFDEYLARRDTRPWWQQAVETIEIHSRNQYRVALAERYGGHPWRGSVRLAWAAMCAPRLTIERLIRVSGGLRNQLLRRKRPVGGLSEADDCADCPANSASETPPTGSTSRFSTEQKGYRERATA
jgi:glycosyltransferase involved in cell wall biosynthesis